MTSAATGGSGGSDVAADSTVEPVERVQSVEPVEPLEPSVISPLIAGVLMVAFGVTMILDALDIKSTTDLLRGPRLFPLVITISWTALSACYLAQQLLCLAMRRPSLPAERFAHPLRVLGVVAVLVGYAFTLESLGYLVTTAVLFVTVAALLGSQHRLRDVAIGVGLSATIYVVFTQLLMVRLPAVVWGL